jgi:hypothetical protein
MNTTDLDPQHCLKTYASSRMTIFGLLLSMRTFCTARLTGNKHSGTFSAVTTKRVKNNVNRLTNEKDEKSLQSNQNMAKINDC